MPWRRSKGPMGRGVHHHRSNGQLGLLVTLGGDRRQQTRRQGRRRTRAPAREPAREQPWCLGSPERPERPLNGPPAMPAAIYPRDVTRECERGLLGMDEVPKGTVGGTHTTIGFAGRRRSGSPDGGARAVVSFLCVPGASVRGRSSSHARRAGRGCAHWASAILRMRPWLFGGLRLRGIA